VDRTVAQGNAVGERGGIRLLGHQPALDGVRALAVLMVLGFHAFPGSVSGGYFGVDLFFALSGFLITSLLLGEREVTSKIDFGAFYIRRALRLFPLIFFVVAVVVVVSLIAGKSAETQSVGRDAPATVLYAANWVFALSHSFPYGPLAHTWSLSIEEQFYVLWPLVLTALLLAFPGNRRLVVALVLAAALVSMIVRVELYRSGAPFERISFGTDTRVAPLLLGCALGMCTTWWGGRARPASLRIFRVVGLLSLAALLWMTLSTRYGLGEIARHPERSYEDGLTIAALASTGLILGVTLDAAWALSRFFSLKPLRWVGRISYGLYLWHVPIFALLTPGFLGLSNTAQGFLGVGLSFGLSAASFYLLEQPCLRLKGRFERRPKQPTSVSPQLQPAET
jgi:peptidoglycan/LPS O-acetylase OafA/YrhL